MKKEINTQSETQKQTPEFKKCKCCGETKPASEFYKHKMTKDGLFSHCKACDIKRNAEWQRNNPKKSYEKAYRWRLANPEKVAEYSKNFRTIEASQRHPDHNVVIEKEMRALAAKLSAEKGERYCVDHIFPPSKGGIHHHENLQVITLKQNSRKGNKLDYFEEGVKNIMALPDKILSICLKNAKELGLEQEVAMVLENIQKNLLEKQDKSVK